MEDRGSRIEDRGSRIEGQGVTIDRPRSSIFYLLSSIFVTSWLIVGYCPSIAQRRPVLRRATRDFLAGKFILITRDERPQGLQEPRMLARVADHDLITPPARVMSDAGALIEWAKGVDYAGAAGVILSLDAISGGQPQAERPDLLKWIRARRPSIPIYAFLQSSSDQAVQSALEALGPGPGSALDFLLISGEAAARSNLPEEIAARKLNGKVAIEPDAGAAVMTLFSRLLNNRFGFAPKIFPVFSSAEAATSPLRLGVSRMIRNAGGVVPDSTTDARGADTLLFVHAPGATGTNRVAFLEAMSRTVETGVKVAVVDISETKESKDELMAWLRRLKLLDKLTSYASSAPGAPGAPGVFGPRSGALPGEASSEATPGDAIIRAVAQASTFLNAVKFMRDDIDRVLRFDRAQFELLFSRYLTDWAYALTIRPAMDDFVKGELKTDPDRLGTATERAEAYAFERVKQSAEELFREQFRRNIHAILLSEGERAQLQIWMMQRLQVRLPTQKTSEVEIRQSVYIAQINYSELSPAAGRARWFLENEEVDERIERRFLSAHLERFKSDVTEVDVTIKLSSSRNRQASPESYAISSSRKGDVRRVTITAPSNQGAFYALSKLEALGADGRLAEDFHISESPAIARRGVAEAFSGSPWSHGDRLETLRFLGLARMNRYVYAPKDDDWRQDYTDQDLERFRRLLTVSEKNFVRFVYAVRPGSSTAWSGDEDAAAIIRKLETMAALGVNSFALCFDDAPATLQNDGAGARFKTLASAQAHLINLVYGRLKRSGADFELYVAPSVSAGDYMKELGAAIPRDVLLFPWDNFAANDAEPQRLFIGAMKGESGQPESANESQGGFIAVAAREPRASMLPIVTAADYAWDRRNYNPQQAFDHALNLLYDERARAALRVWARAYEGNAFKQRLAELQSATDTIGVTLNQGLLRGELVRFIEKNR
ncbi:MAG TPA: DUF4127 family protein [Blastocatellia bacterium]|nr:DUF4127 family protein [Blastocatellia bacterium]